MKKETPQECVDKLMGEALLFSGKAPQHDDMTLLLLHIVV